LIVCDIGVLWLNAIATVAELLYEFCPHQQLEVCARQTGDEFCSLTELKVFVPLDTKYVVSGTFFPANLLA